MMKDNLVMFVPTWTPSDSRSWASNW